MKGRKVEYHCCNQNSHSTKSHGSLHNTLVLHKTPQHHCPICAPHSYFDQYSSHPLHLHCENGYHPMWSSPFMQPLLDQLQTPPLFTCKTITIPPFCPVQITSTSSYPTKPILCRYQPSFVTLTLPMMYYRPPCTCHHLDQQ